MRLASLLESKQSRKFAGVIVRRRRPLGLLLYVAGLVYLVQLPRDEFNHRSFIDENALMVGLVRREFSNPDSISSYSRDMQAVYGSKEELVPWLEARFAAIGLEVYRQNYSATRPAVLGGQSVGVAGCNVYSILRAGRSSSVEALVLSAPHPLPGGGSNLYGLATMLALAEYFKGKSYWAKDIIFLVTSGEEIGTQAWIDSYMGGHTEGIEAGPLPGRSGAIQAVINLEVASSMIQYTDVIIEGVNGILPNLDLVHVVTHSSETEGIPSSFHVEWEPVRYRSKQTVDPGSLYSNQLRTVAAIIAHQAPGLPLGNHALFLRHRIDSVTVRGMKTGEKSGPNSKSLIILARALEGSFRSLNNLLERLHHSEFFYYTPSRGRFISIGQFMPPLGLLLAPLILEGLAQWLLARGHGQSVTADGKTDEGSPMTVSFPFQSVMSLILGSACSGLLLFCLPAAAGQLQSPLGAAGLAASLGWGSCLSIFIPLMSRTTAVLADWHMAKCFSLILQLLLLTTLAMMNYALAICLLLFLPLPAILSQPSGSSGKAPHILGQALLLLSSPPLAVLYLCSLYHALFISSSSDPLSALEGGATLATQGLVLAYTSWHFVGSWLFSVGCLVVWPVWLMNWVLGCQVVCDTETSGSSSGDTASPHPHSD